jgi:hypothetical protein
MPADQSRLEWDFRPAQSMNPDNRQALALEYIAYYLDRIEGHLGRVDGFGRVYRAGIPKSVFL